MTSSPYRSNHEVPQPQILKMLVPYQVFGEDVSQNTWGSVMKHGPMAVLSFIGAMTFFRYSFCGWSIAEYGPSGVLFVKTT